MLRFLIIFLIFFTLGFAQEDIANILATGTLAQVQDLLATGLELNTPLESVFYPLDMAVLNADPAVPLLLVRAGAELNPTDPNRYTPLIWAALTNPNPEVIQALIDAGADIHARRDKKTALGRAVMNNTVEVVKILVEAGADVNEQYDYGQTPLYIAASSNCLDVLAFLIDVGAKANTSYTFTEDITETPLGMVLGSADSPIAWQIARANGEVVNQPCPQAETIAEQRARMLLEAGADPNATLRTDPLLIYTVRARFPELLKLLLEFGVDTETKDRSGRTALLWAGEEDYFYGYRQKIPNILLIEPLVRAGADVNAVAKPGNPALVRGLDESLEELFDTPLIQAARRGDLKSLEVLLEAGAKIDTTNDVGHTALIVAVKERHYQVAEVLLGFGANLTIRDKSSKSALDYDTYDSPLYERLGGEILPVDIFALARESTPETVATLLDTVRFNLKTSDAYGQTLLFYAVLNPDLEMIDVLLERSADINHHDTSGWTALMHAIRDNPNPEMTRHLLELGASPTDHVTWAGIQTPLLTAAQSNRLEVIQMLLDAGVDPLLELPYVARYGSSGALEFVLNHLRAETSDTKQKALDDALLQVIYRQTFTENPNSDEEAARKVELLLRAGMRPDDKRIYPDSTMLLVAIEQGDLETVKVLIAGGADINRVRESEFYLGTNRGVTRVLCTPLALALSSNHIDIAKYLAETGASVEAAKKSLESECASAFLDEIKKQEIEQRLLEASQQ